MWNKPSQERLDKIPRLHETEDIPLDETMIHLHFFFGGSDWYIAEYDGKDTFFGYAILNGDVFNSEWGYISFNELQKIHFFGLEVDCELEELWKVKPFGELGIKKY